MSALGGFQPRRLWRNAQHDELLVNSLYLMLSSAATAGLGFIFWIVVARLYSAESVGLATSLLSATTVISMLSLLGFGSSFVRFLPRSVNRDREISLGLLAAGATALVGAALYVALIPQIASKLEFVRESGWLTLGFVAMTAFAAVNLLTDSVFVAYRAARFNFYIDGLFQSGSKLLALIVFAGSGAFGIFSAGGVAATLAVLASVWILMRRFAYRPRPVVDLSAIGSAFHFTAASYVASIFNLLPILVVPVLVLGKLDSSSAGYYFIAFQITSLLSGVAFAVTQSLLAEVGHAEAGLRTLAIRSARILATTIIPPAIVLGAGGKWLLLVFGSEYSDKAWPALLVLSLSAPAVAAYGWAATLLKATGQLRAMIACNVVYAVVTISLTAVLASRGLVWVAVAWLAGNTAATLTATAPLLRHRSRPRHGTSGPA
jgi:O-antigen/teichoic acid export membrane protein